MKKQELINLVKEKLAAHGAVNVPLVLAVSGGPDSMTLLDIVRQLIFAININVVHVNHGLRKTATRDQKIVEDYCAKHGLVLICKKADVKTVRTKDKTSVEEAARDLRYKILRAEAKRLQAPYILLAHTADDQVETVLFNLVRGASLRGLGGMKEFSADLLRPLLSVHKLDLLAYARQQKLKFGVDETNSSLEYSRNFIRHKLVPVMAKLNPKFSDQLLVAIGNVQGAEAAVRDLARLHIAALAKQERGVLVFPASRLAELTRFMRAEVFKLAADLVGVFDIEWSAAQLTQLDRLVNSAEVQAVRTIAGKLLVQKRYDKISISRI